MFRLTCVSFSYHVTELRKKIFSNKKKRLESPPASRPATKAPETMVTKASALQCMVSRRKRARAGLTAPAASAGSAGRSSSCNKCRFYIGKNEVPGSEDHLYLLRYKRRATRLQINKKQSNVLRYTSNGHIKKVVKFF